MKALIIAPQPFFSPRGTPFSVYYRTMVTSELGVKIDLLTYGEGQDVDLPGVNIIRIPNFRLFGPVKIGPSFLKLFLDIFIFVWAIGLLITRKYNFVHAHEESIFFCAFLKPFFRFKLVYDMHSSLPQQLTNFQFTTSRLLIKMFDAFEAFSIKQSDVVITICPDLSDYANTLIDDSGKEYLIENSIFDPVKLLSQSRTSNGLGHKKKHIENVFDLGFPVIVYTGTLEAYQGIDMALNAFKKVIKSLEDIRFLIVGGNEIQIQYYKNKAKELNIDEFVEFSGLVPKELAIYCTNNADVLVSPRIKGTNTPLKIYEQLASGIPIVATNIYSHTQVLNDEVAFLSDPEPDDYANKILMALKNKNERDIKTKNAKTLFIQKYSKQAYINKMRQVIKRLVV